MEGETLRRIFFRWRVVTGVTEHSVQSVGFLVGCATLCFAFSAQGEPSPHCGYIAVLRKLSAASLFDSLALSASANERVSFCCTTTAETEASDLSTEHALSSEQTLSGFQAAKLQRPRGWPNENYKSTEYCDSANLVFLVTILRIGSSHLSAVQVCKYAVKYVLVV